MAFCVATGIWVLVLGFTYTPLEQLWRERDASALNVLLRFYISGIVYVIHLYAFSRIEESYAENRMLAYLDRLTQLPNRRYGEAVLVHLFRQMPEHSGVFSVIMLDLDGFNQVNDRHGHDVATANSSAAPC